MAEWCVPVDSLKAVDGGATDNASGTTVSATRPMVVLYEPGWFHVLPALQSLSTNHAGAAVEQVRGSTQSGTSCV